MAHLTNTDGGAIGIYDRLAPVYDQHHQRWLRLSGGEAQAALEAAVRVEMKPWSKLLDAGCGTGRFARRLLSESVRPDQITLLDPSGAMLTHCADLPVETSRNRLEALPFPDACFDIVTCAWALETVPAPEAAVDELCRVLRSGGLLCLIFCAEKRPRKVLDWVMQKRITYSGAGRFLDTDQIGAHIRYAMTCDVQLLPSSGPAATLIARRHRA
ncbi:class I SAM-dependent methyltransferase [Tropicimonas sp. S265A]|uniref:class I SAM-dependent methyltransferase n=1 Tax=Tropicimonas sp. S265A TaxID=3415134 RepID=UPI003C7D2364